MRPAKKHLNFQSLRQAMADVFLSIPDKRNQQNTRYSIHDVLMSGFAMMYFQDPSLLQFQQRMQAEQQHNNVSSLFKVKELPQATQMREISDEVDREVFRPLFKEYLHRLQRGKHLEGYQLFKNQYLCPIDGSQYFRSDQLTCPGCLKKEQHGGKVSYSHQILQASIVHPDKRQVLPLMPEEIRNEDGSEKQDCELKAGKRLVGKIRKDHPQLEFIIVGDGLYSKRPFIETLEKYRMHYILVAKPDDHKLMMEWFGEQEDLGEIQTKEVVDKKGRIHRYEWVNHIPLNGNKKAKWVNFFRYFLIVTDKKDGNKITYKNSWVTDLEITFQNIEKLVKGGRCRWKIENECFNTLKNQGYHIEHNYGHGKKNLSFNFLLLNLLAFFYHQIFELTDELYQGCRRKCGSKQHLWETIRGAIKWLFVESWEMLLNMILTPENFRLVKNPP